MKINFFQGRAVDFIQMCLLFDIFVFVVRLHPKRKKYKEDQKQCCQITLSEIPYGDSRDYRTEKLFSFLQKLFDG